MAYTKCDYCRETYHRGRGHRCKKRQEDEQRRWKAREEHKEEEQVWIANNIEEITQIREQRTVECEKIKKQDRKQ